MVTKTLLALRPFLDKQIHEMLLLKIIERITSLFRAEIRQITCMTVFSNLDKITIKYRYPPLLIEDILHILHGPS